MFRWGHGFRCPRDAHHNGSTDDHRRPCCDSGTDHYRRGPDHHRSADHHRDTNNYLSGLNNHRRADALCCTNNDRLADQYRIFLIGAAPEQCDCWMWIVFFAAAGSRVV